MIDKMHGKKGESYQTIKMLCVLEAAMRIKRGTVVTLEAEAMDAIGKQVEKLIKKRRLPSSF